MLEHFPILLAVGSEAEDYVRDLLVILLAAAAVSIFTRRIRLPSIPGYLIVGALFGGSVFGFIKSDENVRQITDLAIVLLMFTIGLHLDTDSIRSGMVSILIVGVASTVGSALALWPLGLAIGLSWEQSLAVGLSLSMSSTAVVLGILQQRREVHRIHGRLCVGIALTQDLLAIAFLLLIPVLAHAYLGSADAKTAATAHHIADTTVLQKLASVGKALLGVGALIGFGRWVMPRLLREASRDSNTEALLVVSAAGALAAAVITSVLGVGAALGAFLAGFLLSATPFRHQLAGQLSPMRDLFMAVFFTAVGIKVNIGQALDAWWVVGLGVVALLAVKTAVIGFATWAGGATAPIAGLTATLLSQGGEFSLVILGIATNEYGMFGAQERSVLIAVVVLSLILTTPIYELGIRSQEALARIPLARWITNPALSGRHAHAPALASADAHQPAAAHDADADDPPLPYPHRPVIIAGFGVVGRNLVEHFAAAGIPYVVIELNPATVVKQQKLGRRFVFGDITNPDVLESAGIHAAEAIVLTIPDDDAVLRSCRVIRHMNPSIFIAARTSYLSRAIAATELGADYVTVEEVVTAQDMAKQVMERLAKRLVGEA